MKRQSSLGNEKMHRTPGYSQTRIGHVTSTKDYRRYGRIEVVFLDYSTPFPVWVVGDIDRTPCEGDKVVVGYMEGRKDAPYLAGYVRNGAYTSNFIDVSKERVRVQIPVFDLNVRNGTAHNDVKGHLLDDTKQQQRAFVELSAEKQYAKISYPTSKSGEPCTITLNEERVEAVFKNARLTLSESRARLSFGGRYIEVNAGGVTEG